MKAKMPAGVVAWQNAGSRTMFSNIWFFVSVPPVAGSRLTELYHPMIALASASQSFPSLILSHLLKPQNNPLSRCTGKMSLRILQKDVLDLCMNNPGMQTTKHERRNIPRIRKMPGIQAELGFV